MLERAARIDDVAAGRAVAFHQLGLLGERLRRRHVAHHEEADRFHAQVTRVFDVLPRDIGLGAMRRHTHDARACLVGRLQVMDGADAGQQQRGDLGVLDDAGDRFDPFDVRVGAEAVVEAAALEAVAMRDLDGVDHGFVEYLGDLSTCATEY
jgi:hypothetical protein